MNRRYFLRQLALLAISGGWVNAFSTAQAMPRSRQELRAIADNLTKTGIAYGSIPSLNSPQYISMGEASMMLDANEPVFLVTLADIVHVFPQRIMVWHEVVNELIRNHAYCITYSPISGTMAAYDATVNRNNLIFDAEGRLYNSSSILIDRNTGSLWSQVLGMAFDGPMAGSGLKILPSYWTTWAKARECYADDKTVKILSTPRGTQRNYGRDPYGSYLVPGNYYDDERLLYPMTRIDSRFSPKTPIMGIEVDTVLASLEIAYVRQARVVNFFAGLAPLVAIFDPRLGVVRVYDRRIWDDQNPSLFTYDGNTLRDVQTRSAWDVDGKCLDGNLQGASMQQYFGIYSFWVTWAAFHPESEVVPGPTVVPDSALVIGRTLN